MLEQYHQNIALKFILIVPVSLKTFLCPGGAWNPANSLPANDTSGSASQPANDNPPKIDFDRVISNIKELNMIAGDGETKIEKTTSGARFKVR